MGKEEKQREIEEYEEEVRRKEEEKYVPRNAQQMWTDEDLVTLAKLIKKIPGGSSDRWERIAEIMERYPWEVTKMGANIKNNPSIVPKMQGVTGREKDRMVSDECLEEDYGSEDTGTENSEDEVDEDGYLVLQPSKPEEYIIPEEKKKKKTKGGKLGETEPTEEDAWSQDQQKSLEAALSQYPKGTSERWERIAGKVEGKSKEQCMLRFKFLAEQIKKK